MTPSIKALLGVTLIVFMFFPTYKAEGLCKGPQPFNAGVCGTAYKPSWPGNGFILAGSFLNPKQSLYEPQPGTYTVQTEDDFGSLESGSIIQPYFAAQIAIISGVTSFFLVLLVQSINNRRRSK